MTGAKSRWADDEADAAARRREKEEKKRAKLERAQRDTEAAAAAEDEARRRADDDTAAAAAAQQRADDTDKRPVKRRRLSNPDEQEDSKIKKPAPLLRFAAPEWGPSRHVDNFERLNHIEEGSYGWVSRARETATAEIVALKKLKMDNTNDGFPVTALREIQTLKESRHRHIVHLREVVVGDGLNDIFLVMEFLEHDLKTLQDEMAEPFLPSEIKTLLLQLTSAVDYLHEHWILHRDLKTSNILMNNRGEIKLADFGMARHFSSPPPPDLTQLVVTLWYRAPELLLGTTTYGTPVDMWSIGCIFGELLSKQPLLQGKNEVDQLSRIFSLCGVPTDAEWPSFRRLPNARSLKLPTSSNAHGSVLRAKFPFLTRSGSELLNALLALNPASRPTAAEVLDHPYFAEAPRPKTTAMFPTFPSKAGGERRRRIASPSAPQRGDAPKLSGADFSGIFADREAEEVGGGFSLRMA